MWRAYAIKSGDGGWPPEVWLVFGSLSAAREYVERARWDFRIEVMPVYDSYEECPLENRGLDTRLSAIAQRSLCQLESERPTWMDQDDLRPEVGVVHAVAAHDSDNFGYSEVELFYATLVAAERHVANAYAMSAVVPFAIHRSYQDCPADRRFDGSGEAPGWSQLLNQKP
jgi:hypothetical protein